MPLESEKNKVESDYEDLSLKLGQISEKTKKDHVVPSEVRLNTQSLAKVDSEQISHALNK